MTTEAWATLLVGGATILAIIVEPILALHIQRKLDHEREAKNRKLWIFKTLMSYRSTRLSPQFVQALNLIDVEFTDSSEKAVRDAWKECQDHFAEWGRQTPEEKQQQAKANVERADELVAEMLVKMAVSLGYSFDKVYVKKGWYYPEGLSEMELEWHAVRKGLLRVLSGEAKLPIAVFEEKFPPLTGATEPPAVKPASANAKPSSH